MPNVITVDGIKVNKDTGKPMGRPPKDPAKLATYNDLRAKAVLAEASGVSPDLGEHSAFSDDPNVTNEEIIEQISDRFNILQKIARGACEGSVRSVIISGRGGTGKTHTLEQILEFYQEEENVQVEMIKGIISPINLYMTLFRNRTKNCVVVLDDADNIFWNEDGLSILKVALDSSFKRKISWMSQSAALKESGTPESFYFEGSMIFITNINFQNVVDSGKGKLVPHLEALMTRALYLDLKLHSPRDVGLWIDYMVSKHHILVQDGLTKDQQEDVLDFIAENRDKLRNLSIRTALKLSYLVKMNPDGWRKDAATLELK